MAMVGIMGTGRLREEAVAHLNDAKMLRDTSAKINMLKRLKEMLLHRDPSLLHEFVPHLMELQMEPSGPIRNYLVQIIQEIGLKHSQYIPLMAPVLLALMRDDTPAVARHAISTGSSLFRFIFEQVALQGVYSGHVDTKLQDAWEWMTSLKDAMYAASQEHKNDGVRLLAIKFVEAVVLLFTPEPNGPSLPPPSQTSEKNVFNVAWLHGGHPILDVGSLGQEASRSLSLLLGQLRVLEASKVPGPVAVVLVNSLASVAKQRPSLYGRVLPVLLGLVPACKDAKGGQMASVAQALRNALTSLLKCTHSGAGPWRERVVSALKAMKEGDAAEAAASGTESEKNQLVDRNRPTQENGDMDEHPGKRARASPNAVHMERQPVLEEVNMLLGTDRSGDSTSLEQMMSILGALVAKGEEGVSSVDNLIAQLPADMLADVVIENMRNLPSLPPAVSPGASVLTSAGLGLTFGMPLSAVGSFGQCLASLSAPEKLASADHPRDPRRDPRLFDLQDGMPIDVKLEEAVPTSNVANSKRLAAGEGFTTPCTSEEISFIPGISKMHASQEAPNIHRSTSNSDVVMSSGATSVAPRIQSLAISLSTVTSPSNSQPSSSPSGHRVELVDAMDVSEAMPLDVSEAKLLRSRVPEPTVSTVTGTDSKNEVLDLATRGAIVQTPPAVMPVVALDASQQSALWKAVLLRLLENQKLVVSGGGSELRLSLLARFLKGSNTDDEAWDLLRKHILVDYQNSKGHELAMHILYHLYAEKLSSEDDPSGAAATSLNYEKFFLFVAGGLKDAKSLSKLLGEAPLVPEAALKLVEVMCNPGIEIKEGTDIFVAERVTQGLTAVWSLILLRPPIRAECVEIALKSTVHELEEVRTKAIRLVANKLYPLSYISQSIEDYAMRTMLTVLEMDGEEFPQIQGLHNDQMPGRGPVAGNDFTADEEQKTDKGFLSVQEAHRRMSLYFALCTKNHSLLREIFNIYERSPKVVKQTVHKHMPVLIRTIGPQSDDVLEIISDPPDGSKNLVFLVLHVLTELAPPSPQLITAVKKLHESKIKDAKLLIPILSSLSKEEVLPIFPSLVALPSQDFKGALDRILQGSVSSGPALTPAEVLIAIHGIDPEKDHVHLSMVKDACTVCFQQRSVFTQQVLAKVLNQLVEQTPLPMLFMRTVIQAVGSFRPLVSFVMEILSRLVSKQIWKWPNLWIGFLKCAEQTQPHSFPVLLQLPALHLEKALTKLPNLRAPLTAHASKQAVRSTLPRSTLLVLGLAQQDASLLESAPSGPAGLVEAPAATALPLSNPDAGAEGIESVATS